MANGVDEAEVQGETYQRWHGQKEQEQKTEFDDEGQALLRVFEQHRFNNTADGDQHDAVEKKPHTGGVVAHKGLEDHINFWTVHLADSTDYQTTTSKAFHRRSASAK